MSMSDKQDPQNAPIREFADEVAKLYILISGTAMLLDGAADNMLLVGLPGTAAGYKDHAKRLKDALRGPLFRTYLGDE